MLCHATVSLVAVPCQCVSGLYTRCCAMPLCLWSIHPMLCHASVSLVSTPHTVPCHCVTGRCAVPVCLWSLCHARVSLVYTPDAVPCHCVTGRCAMPVCLWSLCRASVSLVCVPSHHFHLSLSTLSVKHKVASLDQLAKIKRIRQWQKKQLSYRPSKSNERHT